MEEEAQLVIRDNFDGDVMQAIEEAYQNPAVAAAKNAAEVIRDHFTAAQSSGNPKSIPVEITLFYQTELMVQTIIYVVEHLGVAEFAAWGGLLHWYRKMKEFDQLRQLKRDGKELPKKQKDTLASYWWTIKSTVVRGADSVLTTNNISATTLAREFEATVWLQDKGARATFAGSIVPLTCFPLLEGWIIFANEKQLDAMALSQQVNEFDFAHTWSVFTLLLERHFPQTTLDVEYRYPEEICQWISEVRSRSTTLVSTFIHQSTLISHYKSRMSIAAALELFALTIQI